MKIAGSHTLPFPIERAYQLMQDPGVLARAIPGCESLEKIGEDEYRMKMKMVLASLSGAFEGKVKIADQAPPALKELARTTEPGAADSVEFPDSMADRADPVRASFRLLVEGTGKIGFVKGDGLLTLTTSAAGTDVGYEGDVQVGGTMAAVGQRLIDGTAKMMIKRFFEKLAEQAAQVSS